VLYSNLDMLNKLNKYNKKIPKTWDELIEISKFISEKETELNNTQFITFNGLFCVKFISFLYFSLLFFLKKKFLIKKKKKEVIII